MATIEFGSLPKTANDFIKEIYDLVGVQFPLDVVVLNDGSLIQVKAETSWREGEVIPIEEEVEFEKTVLNDDGEEVTTTELKTIVVDYEQNYTEKSLTEKQIANLDKYISDNIEQ